MPHGHNHLSWLHMYVVVLKLEGTRGRDLGNVLRRPDTQTLLSAKPNRSVAILGDQYQHPLPRPNSQSILWA